jgi:threonine dehydrogenase-like Zn-dependent dehydrogenase
MRRTMLYGPRDIRFEDRPEPTIFKPAGAILRLSATCICGSDLSPYRGIAKFAEPMPMGTGWSAADEGYSAMDERRAIKTLLRP